MKTGFRALLLVTVASLSMVPAAPAQDSPVVEGFRVDVATGALTPLASSKAVKEKKGGYLYCYLDDASSPVTFRHDEPLAFTYRWDGSRRDVEDVRKRASRDSTTYRLEFLSASDGGRRYGTGKFVPMDQERYGEIVSDVNPKKPKHVGQSFLLKPRGALAPGEYAFAYAGIVWEGTYYANALCNPWTVSAFRIVEGAPLTQAPPPPPSATSPPSPAAPANSASDVQGLRRAAEQGDAAAQGRLGHLHFLGRGVLQDYVEAYKWLNIAAARLEGDDRNQWVELRDKVAALMTPVERAEAQRRAVDWMHAFQQGNP
jgi:hypothetical protein